MEEPTMKEMMNSLKGMGIDPGRFSKDQLTKILTLADKIKDPANLTPEVLKEVGKILGGGSRTDTGKRKKVGRNDPCPCKSGKKYKKCCLLQKT